MKKLLALFVATVAMMFHSYSQVVTYDIPISSFTGVVINSGDFCFDPGEYKQSSVGNTWGFSWTSTGVNAPTSVQVELIFTINDATGPHPTTLNGSSDASISPAFASCGFILETYTLDPSNYSFGALNTFLMDYSASPQQNQIYPNVAWGPGIYARVTVDYTPCNDPDVPTIVATPSTVCAGSSSTLSWTGDLNSATDWYIYSGSCGGTLEGTTTTSSFVVTPGATTTYYIRGEGGCIVPGACGSVTVNVGDAIAPVADVDPLSDVTAECSVTPTAPTATDNCAGAVIGTPDVSFPITTQGTTTVTWTYDDGAGNTSTQTQDVILDDVTAPVPDASSLADATAECSLTPTAPTATDNCVGAVTGTPDVSFPITTQGTTTVTWTYDDGNGNTSTQMQDIIIDDVTPPTFSGCPSDQFVDADNAGCTALVSWVDPTVLDNCTGATFTSSHSSPFAFPEGTTTVTYTATDIGGNTATCSFDVTVTNTLSVVVDGSVDVACFGESTGSIDVTTSLGNAPYIWDWNSGAYSTEDLTSIPAGTYDLIATDDVGCTAALSVVISEPTAALNVSLDVANDPSSCGGTDGSIDVTTSGGTTAYSWDWNSGTYSTEDLTGLSAGTYDLTATDANGCTFDLSVSLSDPGGPTIVLDSIVDALCYQSADGGIYISATGGTAPLSFDWDDDGTGDFDDSEDLTGLTAGSYAIVVQDAAGCSSSASGTVNEPAQLDTGVTVDGHTLTANGAGLSYQWIDCTSLSDIPGETNQDFTVTDNGEYAVVVSDGICSDTSSCYEFVDLSTGSLEDDIVVKLFPNPVEDVLTVELNKDFGSFTVTIMNAQGKLLYEQFVESSDAGNVTFQFSQYASGVYFLRLESQERVMTKEIIKK